MKTFYFDNAATTFPKPAEVYDFMDFFYRAYGANAGRGQYKISSATSKLIFETRGLVKSLLLCPNKEVVFAPSATVAMNMLILGIERARQKSAEDTKAMTVYISPFEHNAVTRTLHSLEKDARAKVNVLPIQKDFSYDLEKIDRLFEKEKPDLLILSHVSNVCGLVCPVEKLCALAKKRGSLTILDMAQSAVLLPLNVGSDDFDFAVFAGHKTMMGPLGVSGFAANPKALLQKVFPVLFGGTGVESAKQDMPFDLPSRFEMGSVNIQAIAGLNAALKWWSRSKEEIRAKENAAHRALVELLNLYDFIHIVGPSSAERFSEKTPCVGVVSCVFEGYSPDEIGNVLDEKNVAVRTGLQCAPLAHKTLGTFPAGTARFSVGAFTSDEDFAGLEDAMEWIKENI